VNLTAIDYSTGPHAPVARTIKLARYHAEAIHTEADLTAFRPNDSTSPLGGWDHGGTWPQRIETVKEWTILTTAGDDQSTGTAGYANDEVIPTNQFTGPQLLILELPGAWAASQPSSTVFTATIRTVEIVSGTVRQSIGWPRIT
jgi:hypothetical protein